MNADEAMNKILELLDEDDTAAVDELVEAYEDDLDTEEIFREAVRRGAEDYVSCHVEDFDLYDYDFGSSLLSETDDPSIRDILINAGATPDPDDFSDCRMVYQDWSEEFEMDESLYAELAEKILERIGLTREQFAEKLSTEETAEEKLPAPLQNYSYAEIESMVEIIDEDDLEGEFEWCDHSPMDMIDLLEKTGFEVEQEGLAGAHGHGGWWIFYIR